MCSFRHNAALFLIAAATLAKPSIAAAHEVPEGEIARVPASESLAFRVEFNNDSYSVFPGDDWDDFRTFGAYVGIAARRWVFELTADAFTERGANLGEGSRVDEAYAILSRKVAEFSRSSFPGGMATAEIRTGVGALATGDFGTLALQDFVHSAYGCVRETPSAKSAPETRCIGVANAAVLGGWNAPFLPPFFSATLEVGTSGFTRFRGIAGFDVQEKLFEARAYGGFVRAAGYGETGGIAFSRTLDSENGWYAGLTVRIKPIETGFSWNASENRQSGYVALVFGQGDSARDSARAKGATGTGRRNAPSRMNVDFRIVPLYAGLRLRRAVLRFPVTGSVAFGMEGGPIPTQRQYVLAGEHYRYEQVYLGLELSREAFGFVEYYLLAAGGIREETLKTAVATKARLIDRALSPVFVGEGGLRLYPPNARENGACWGVGISGVIQYAEAIIPGWCPFFQLYLTGRSL